jgi:integrase
MHALSSRAWTTLRRGGTSSRPSGVDVGYWRRSCSAAAPSTPGAPTLATSPTDEQRTLLVAAAADGLRSTTLVTLLLHNGLRIDEALSRDVEHLQTERGHRVLRLHRKGGRVATAALAAPTARALDAYLAGRQTGPIFTTRTGRRMDGRRRGA